LVILRTEIKCSFCGKEKHDVAVMITGPSANICNECLELCIRRLAETVDETIGIKGKKEIGSD